MAKPKEDKPEMLCESQVMERGWSKTMVKTFLKESDETKQNPNYRKAAPMKLYLLSRVKKVERTKSLKEMLVKYKLKKVSAAKAVDTKIAKLMKQVDNMGVYVKKLSDKKVLNYAIDSYNSFSMYREREFASKHSDPNFLERITVNFIRHELTDCDQQLEAVARKTGVGTAFVAISKKVFAKIAEVYPSLKTECDRQLDYRFGEPDFPFVE